MQVLAVTPELFPLVKTGGLADVAGALPLALAERDCTVRSLLPLYPAVRTSLPAEVDEVAKFAELFGGPARLLAGRHASGLELLLLDAPHLYDRPGGLYLDPTGRDWPDNGLRFAGLSWVASAIGQGCLEDWRPDIVHAHDWQAGLAPAYLALADQPRPATVLTIHNLAFQGLFDAGLLPTLRLPTMAWSMHGIEYHGRIGFLKAGLYYADRLTTVSPAYAREIRSEPMGMGLAGLLATRGDDLVGIVNGIDEAVWNPADDPHLPAPYGPRDLAGKAVCKAALQRRFRLAETADRPLFVVISRLTEQKGLDLLLAAVPLLVRHGAQLAVLGSGDPGLEAGFAAAARAHPTMIGFTPGYDEPLAHQLQGGGDAVLVPSRFEPCGLTQLCGLRYGTLPVVARVGGLGDTVIDANTAALADAIATGFVFTPPTVPALEEALLRAFELFADRPIWHRMQRRAMTRRVGWRASAERYLALYQALLAGSASPPELAAALP